MEGHPPIPNNKPISIVRLKTTSANLEKKGVLSVSKNCFMIGRRRIFWETVDDDSGPHHYLPPEAVIKLESVSTPVRPVLDPSCKASGQHSLNDCLHKGHTFIQLKPAVLIVFRKSAVGFTSNIMKAIQMLKVHENDRDFSSGKKKKRRLQVSTFRCDKQSIYSWGNFGIPHKFSKMYLYVDNSVSSEHNIAEYFWFCGISVDIMADPKMDLLVVVKQGGLGQRGYAMCFCFLCLY